MDKQVCFNIFMIFILPLLLGAAFRLLFLRARKGWLCTVFWGILATGIFLYAKLVNQHGSEGAGLRAVVGVQMTVGSLLAGAAVWLGKRRKRKA